MPRSQTSVIPWWQVDLGDGAPPAAASAVASRLLSQGPITEEVELRMAALLGSKHAIATSSGSTALTLALMAAGAEPGDVVVCPAYTWIATAHAAHVLGCSIEVVDILPDRPVLDVTLVPPSEGRRRFVIPVHMNGHAVDVKSLIDLGYVVIEDAAQALGSVYKQSLLGTSGDMGCFSFSVSKIIGSGQGGLIVTDSDRYAGSARAARTHGVVDVFAPDSWKMAGHNFRYNDVLAAILLTQIDDLPARISYLRQIASKYIKTFGDNASISIVRHNSQNQFGPYVEARVERRLRDALVGFLDQNGVGARRAFPPIDSAQYLHLTDTAPAPHAHAWADEVLYLPSGPGLRLEDVDRVGELVFNGIAHIQKSLA